MSDKIKPEIKALAKEIVIPDFVDGKSTTTEDNLISTLPEGVTRTQLDLIDDHRSQYVAAGVLAGGEKAIKAFEADKKLQSLSLTLDLANGRSMSTVFTRKEEYPNLKNRDEPGTVKYCTTGFKLSTPESNTHAGQLKQVRAHLNASALAALG